jgi:hypothetical protein
MTDLRITPENEVEIKYSDTKKELTFTVLKQNVL